MNTSKIALAPFLRSCSAVLTLGVRAGLDDYSPQEKDLLRRADRIFFPTLHFCDIFQALGKPTFPNPTTYRYQRSRVLQQLLFQYLKLPTPHSRVYFGARQKNAIPRDFGPPFLVLGPRVGSGKASYVHRVEDQQELQMALSRHNSVIVRHAAAWGERIRFICVQYECIGALRYVPQQSGHACFEPVRPEHRSLQDPLSLTLELVRTAQLDDILVEWGYSGGNWQLIELARPPVTWDSMQGRFNRFHHIGMLIQAGIL
jgi:ribosomal protein S6--L-glutamate ligase